MKPQHFTVRGESFFVCDYTGAPILKRYFVPAGKYLKRKEGCYATLPILLRHMYELWGKDDMKEFDRLKETLQEFYVQPDIPMQPTLAIEKVPLSKDELRDYMLELDMGLGWLLVPKSEQIEDFETHNLKSTHKRVRK